MPFTLSELKKIDAAVKRFHKRNGTQQSVPPLVKSTLHMRRNDTGRSVCGQADSATYMTTEWRKVTCKSCLRIEGMEVI